MQSAMFDSGLEKWRHARKWHLGVHLHEFRRIVDRRHHEMSCSASAEFIIHQTPRPPLRAARPWPTKRRVSVDTDQRQRASAMGVLQTSGRRSD